MNSVFGLKHIILLAVSVVIIVLGSIFSKKLSFKRATKTLFIIGIISETIKIFYYIIQNESTHGGLLPKTDLPFHLCSIQLIFIMIICITKNENLKRYLVSFMLPTCLIGGFAALLLPAYSALNGLWIISFQYFAYHISLVIFAIYLIISKDIKFTAKDYVNCLKMLLIIMFFSIYINSVVNDGSGKINFMYVVSPPMENLPFLNKDNGWLVYIMHYALLVLTCVTLCYIKPIITFFVERKKNKKEKIKNTDENV